MRAEGSAGGAARSSAAGAAEVAPRARPEGVLQARQKERCRRGRGAPQARQKVASGKREARSLWSIVKNRRSTESATELAVFCRSSRAASRSQNRPEATRFALATGYLLPAPAALKTMAPTTVTTRLTATRTHCDQGAGLRTQRKARNF